MCAEGLLDGVAQVLPDKPPICDLDRVRGRCGGDRGVGASPVPADHLDALTGGEPAGEGVCLPVFQQVNGCTGLAAHQHTSVHMAALKAKSSTLSTRGVGAAGSGVNMIRRSMVVLLTGAGSSAASRAPGRPDSTMPIAVSGC